MTCIVHKYAKKKEFLHSDKDAKEQNKWSILNISF